jgi:surfeit locus 1 family protein
MRQGARIVVLVAAVVAAGSTARLGFWQLGRAQEKLALQASRDERIRLAPLGAADLARDAAAAVQQAGRRVELSGAWLPDASVALENRTMGGRVGFFVVTPFVLDDGRLLAVQRGWLPRDAADRTRLPPHSTPSGQVQLRGRIAPTASRLYQLGAAASGPIRQNLDLDDYARELRRPLAPFVVVQDDAEPGAPSDGLLRQWPQPGSDVHKHHGYAFQWFGLSALVVILYVWFQLIRPRRLARR